MRLKIKPPGQGKCSISARRTEFHALNRLAQQIDTTVAKPPAGHPSGIAAVVWNPHPHPFHGHVELEGCLDYRPIWQYDGRASEIPLRVLGAQGKELPFQEIATENRSIVHVPWRKRVVVPVSLPSLGWNVLEFGWVEGAVPPKVKNPVSSGAGLD